MRFDAFEPGTARRGSDVAFLPGTCEAVPAAETFPAASGAPGPPDRVTGSFSAPAKPWSAMFSWFKRPGTSRYHLHCDLRGALAAVLLAAAAFAVPAAGRSAQPAVRAALEPARIAVGDRARLAVEVDHDAGASVAWPEPETLGPFEVLERRIDEPRVEGERAVSRAVLVLTAFELGELEVPAVEIEVLGADGAARTVATEPRTLTVASVGLDEGGGIRAIKGPLDLPLDVAALLPWLAGVVLLAGIAYWWWLRRGRAPEDVPAPPPPRPPHELAYEAFRALEAERLPERGEIKTFHVRASDVVRVYVEGRFGVDALEMTTGEVLDGLRGREVDEEVLGDFRRLLERCDLVKFARDRPALERCREVVPLGWSLVDRTRVIVPPPPAEAGADAEPARAGAGAA